MWLLENTGIGWPLIPSFGALRSSQLRETLGKQMYPSSEATSSLLCVSFSLASCLGMLSPRVVRPAGLHLGAKIPFMQHDAGSDQPQEQRWRQDGSSG